MKKTLFIESRTGGDFTMDAIWAGLVDKLGYENVIDWPPKDKHREGVPTVTGNKEIDYGAERRSLCYTRESGRLQKLSADRIRNLFLSGQIERIFVDERQETFVEFISCSAQFFPEVPVVVISGHDRMWGSIEQLTRFYGNRIEALFLDNWRKEYDTIAKAFPISYGTNFDHLWDVTKRDEFNANKLYDVCFLGYNSHPDRERFFRHIHERYSGSSNAMFIETRPNTMDSFLRKSEYFRIMAQSKICINLRGGAENGKALRFYEIPYVGSCMVSQTFDGMLMTGMDHMRHCAYFSTENELDEIVSVLLSDDRKRESIARAGHEYTMANHTARARVDYIYESIEGRK